MKSFRQLSFAAVLTLMLSISALAGVIGSPGATGNISTPGITSESSNPGIAGDISCPGIAADPGILSVLLSLLGF